MFIMVSSKKYAGLRTILFPSLLPMAGGSEATLNSRKRRTITLEWKAGSNATQTSAKEAQADSLEGSIREQKKDVANVGDYS